MKLETKFKQTLGKIKLNKNIKDCIVTSNPSPNFYLKAFIISDNELIREGLDNILNDIVNITSLIISDGYDEYSYVHKSIQEYFAATYLKETTLNQREVFYSKVSESYDVFRVWENVLVFLKIIDSH
ncbi:MAG: hypothetical protein P8X70_03335, partial [Nanoarchaeota archaeon]